MGPQYLATLTVTPVPGTALFRQVETGGVTLPDPFETLEEMRRLRVRAEPDVELAALRGVQRAPHAVLQPAPPRELMRLHRHQPFPRRLHAKRRKQACRRRPS
jgi:hypothetical protein